MVKINKKDYIVKQLEEQKIEDIIIIDTSKTSSMSDWVIIGNGRSGKQIESAMENLKIDLKKKNLSEGQISGVANDGWILYDLGNVIVHLFVPEVRDIYKLEQLLNPKIKKEKKEVLKETKKKDSKKEIKKIIKKPATKAKVKTVVKKKVIKVTKHK